MTQWLADAFFGLVGALAAADDDPELDEESLPVPVVPCRGALRVEVYDEAGRPVPMAAVDAGGPSRRFHTDSRGWAEIDDIPAGACRVTASKYDWTALR